MSRVDRIWKEIKSLSTGERAELLSRMGRDFASEMASRGGMVYEDILSASMKVLYDLFGIDIRQKSRQADYVDLRGVFFFRMRQEGIPCCTIGRFVGVDHATVIYNCKRMAEAFKYPNMFRGMPEKYAQFNDALLALLEE